MTENLEKETKKSRSISKNFKRQWLLILPFAVFVYASYLIYGEFQASQSDEMMADQMAMEPINEFDQQFFDQSPVALSEENSTTSMKPGPLIGDSYQQNSGAQQSPLATSVEAQINGQQQPLISESFDVNRQAQGNQQGFSGDMIPNGWPELTRPLTEQNTNAGWNDTMEADFAALGQSTATTPKAQVKASTPPTPPVDIAPPEQAFPSISTSQAQATSQTKATMTDKTTMAEEGSYDQAQIAMIHPAETHTLEPGTQQPASQKPTSQQPAWLAPMVEGRESVMEEVASENPSQDDPFLSTVEQRLAALSQKQRSKRAQESPSTQVIQRRPVQASGTVSNTVANTASKRPEQALLEATQNPSTSNKTNLVSELIVGDTVEEKARNLVFNAELLYKEEGAQKVLALLKRYHDEPAVSSRVRGELNSEYVKYNRLYQAYLRGQKAFALNEKEAAFKQWATFLREEKKVIFSAKPSLYASEVRKIVASEYVKRAKQAEQRQAWSLAWKNWESAIRFGENSEAKQQLHRIEKLAKTLFDKGVSLEESDPNAASEHLVEVMAILPQTHPLHAQAKSKVAWLNQWIN